MFIHEMTESACRQVLERTNFGRLACARDNQPYVVPVYFTYSGKYIYGFTTIGQKIEWMRLNPKVCLEIDEWKSHTEWMSVIVFGRFEELLEIPEYNWARTQAYELLKKRAMWWEPAYVSAMHRDHPHSLTPVFYRIRIDRMTGHRAMPDWVEATPETSPQVKHRGLLSRLLPHSRIKN